MQEMRRIRIVNGRIGAEISFVIMRTLQNRVALGLGVVALSGLHLLGATPGGATNSSGVNHWSATASVTAKVTLDDNVFLQNVTALGFRDSIVSNLMLAVALKQTGDQRFSAALNYSAEMIRYHSEHSENHVMHRATANFSGKNEAFGWEWNNGVQLIAGSDVGPNFAVGGDIPAAGGIPIRERRDAEVYRGAWRMNWTVNEWLVRSVVSYYDHDFQTQQRARIGADAGYSNYIDRSEISAGLDIGRRIATDRPWLLAGYRFGRQRQGALLGIASPYANDFHRVLLGFEGAVSSTMKVNVTVGPDFRRFGTNPNPAFRGSEILWFVDASLTFTPTAADTVTFSARRFEQPAFASHSVYEDCTYEVAWRRKMGAKLTATASVRTYITDFQAPANREDWIVTPALAASYVFSHNLSADFSYSRDRAKSHVPATSARDYTRQLFTAGVKFIF